MRRTLIFLPFTFLATIATVEEAAAEAAKAAYNCHHVDGDQMGYQIVQQTNSKNGLPCEFWMYPINYPPQLVEYRQHGEDLFYCGRILTGTIVAYRERGWQCAPANFPIPEESNIGP